MPNPHGKASKGAGSRPPESRAIDHSLDLSIQENFEKFSEWQVHKAHKELSAHCWHVPAGAPSYMTEHVQGIAWQEPSVVSYRTLVSSDETGNNSRLLNDFDFNGDRV